MDRAWNEYPIAETVHADWVRFRERGEDVFGNALDDYPAEAFRLTRLPRREAPGRYWSDCRLDSRPLFGLSFSGPLYVSISRGGERNWVRVFTLTPITDVPPADRRPRRKVYVSRSGDAFVRIKMDTPEFSATVASWRIWTRQRTGPGTLWPVLWFPDGPMRPGSREAFARDLASRVDLVEDADSPSYRHMPPR